MRGIALFFAVLLAAVVYSLIFRSDADHFGAYKFATVVAVNNDRVTIIGSSRLGDQRLTVELTNAQQYQLHNLLTGALEFDEFYQVGDHVVIAQGNGRYTLVARNRLPVLLGLVLIFAMGLLVYAGKIGLYALLSFVGSVGIIFGLLIPALLAGYPPLIITGVSVLMLSSIIILSVAGWNCKGISALAGTVIGLILTMILCIVFGRLLHLDGMTQPVAQAVLFENGMRLDMVGILYAAVLVGASGAAMDVAMEMAATMEEIKRNNPASTRMDLLTSGLRVGNAVIGTMTTTLLLAYAGSFLTLLMLFVGRGSSLMHILNMKLVACEITRTLIGSVSLIIVAPTTAWIASYYLTRES